MNFSLRQFNQLSFVLFFLFGGVIIGETVALTMAVTILGPSIISKLYLVNGLLLLLMPPLFFQNIDKVNRGKLLSLQLLVTAGILLVYLFVYLFFHENSLGSSAMNTLLLILYPLSYLSKTILFLTFWTLANDISTANESKKVFPRIAAWGFIGGLTGACSARLLLVKIDAIMVIGLWSGAYIIGWLISRKIPGIYQQQLLYKEVVSLRIKGRKSFEMMRGVLDSKLILSIAILYFFVFIALFLQDYLFWKKSSFMFRTPNDLASFQFTFYLAHALTTIVGLQFVMPPVIYKWGFVRIFPLLPFSLFIGSLIFLSMNFTLANERTMFMVLIAIQFVRYVVFENAFSPIYQMFFNAIPKEKRGRTKAFLEGIIKPSAIIVSGIIIIPADTINFGIQLTIGIISVVMIYIVLNLRKAYREALLPHDSPMDTSDDIIIEIGSYKDQKIVSLIREYSHSQDADIRSLSVKILAHDGSRQAFTIMNEIFYGERNQSVKETIARSLTNFSSYTTKPFVEHLLSDSNPRIRANALFSLSGMDGRWLFSLKDRVKGMLFENNSRIQIETARFLWKIGDEEDKKNVFSVLDSLCASKNLNKLSAGLYLVGILKPPKWELLLLHYLQYAPLQVFAKCVEAIFQSATRETQLMTFLLIEGLSRKHLAVTGRILQTIGMSAFVSVGDFLRRAKNERMIIEVIHALRMAIESEKMKKGFFSLDQETKTIITEWLLKDLEHFYRDSFVWYHFRLKSTKNEAIDVLEDALRDQLQRLCERILDVMVLLDTEGMVAAVSKDFDAKDFGQRQQAAEIIESLGDTPMIPLIVPILRSDAWEDIAKTGKNHFHFDLSAVSEGIYHFIRSKNRWVCFCAFFYIYSEHADEKPIRRESALLLPLRNDPNIHLAKIAAHFLNNHSELDACMIEPFELLERVMSLKKTLLFRHVSAEKLMGLAEITQCIAYKNGTLISREGEISDHLYIIRKGSLKIVKVKNNVKMVISLLQAGETYGEIGLFNQAPRSASAIANEDCELWIIQRSALKKLLLDMPEIAYNFLEVFSEKLRKSSEEVVDLYASVSKTKKDYF